MKLRVKVRPQLTSWGEYCVVVRAADRKPFDFGLGYGKTVEEAIKAGAAALDRWLARKAQRAA